MSVDPKYADLPWIAHGQPDVYEAGELPEVDQKALRDEIGDGMLPKEIENIKLSVSDAHKRFASSKLDASNVDFSDSISGSGKIGYTITTDEYEVLPPNARDHESIISRLQRLQVEVTQLMDDAASVSGQTKADSKKPINLAELSHVAESLRDQLLLIERQDLCEPASSPEKALFEKILVQLDSFKPSKQNDKKPDTAAPIVYEIYDRQDLTKVADLEKVADLDRRIQRLEALIGQPDPAKLSALTAATAQHSLLEAVCRLSARSALLNPGQLDMIEARLSGLQTRLHTITEKREAISDADNQNKVAELYELVKKWNDVCDGLPMIVERLSELKELHEEASEFSTMLSAVETGQKTIDEKLSSFSKLLEKVQCNLNENMITVKENFSTLESRIA